MPVIGVGEGSVLRMRDFKVERPAFVELYDVESGQLILREGPADGDAARDALRLPNLSYGADDDELVAP